MEIEHHPCADDAVWKALRTQDVTASVAAALLGAHEYETAYGLYMAKTGAVASDVEDTGPVRRGRLLEPVAVQVLREEHPDWRIVHNSGEERLYYRDPATRLGATPDVLAEDPERGLGVVQIKSVEASIYRRKWLAGDAPEPPLWIAVQAMIEASLTGAKWAAVAPIVVGHGVDMPLIEIPIHAGVMSKVRGAVAEFWRRVEVGDPYPPDFSRDAETISRLYSRDDGTEVDLSGDARVQELLAERRVRKVDAKAADARLGEIDAELKAALGNHAAAYVGPGLSFSWKTQNHRGYEVAPTTFRAFRVTDKGAK